MKSDVRSKSINNKYRKTRVYLWFILFLFFSVRVAGQDCPTINLSSTSGSVCGTVPVKISDNTFGGSASYVTIIDNGRGSVSPALAVKSPFSFTYTPSKNDEGKTVRITITTNNPSGSCNSAVATYTLTVHQGLSAPDVGSITHPTCSISTGSVVLSDLPSGSWLLTRTPGGVTTTGTGSSTKISGLPEGKYTFTVTDASGCISVASNDVTINASPYQTAPVVSTVTQPTCNVSTGTVSLSGLPSKGTWTIIRSPDGVTTTGIGTSISISNLSEGNYSFVVNNSSGCKSVASSDVVINRQPITPSAPLVEKIIAPVCPLTTGSVVLRGLPTSGTWTLTCYPGSSKTNGTGANATVADLAEGTYNFTVTNSDGCTSIQSASIAIPRQSVTINLIINNPPSVCSPLKVDLTSSAVTAGSSTGLTYSYWTNAAATNAYATPAAAGTGTYYIKGTLASGCFAIKPVTVTINPVPVAKAGTGGSECDLNFNLNAIPSIGVGTWTKSTGPGTVTFTPNANSANATAAVSEFGNYTFLWTEVSGTCSSSSAVAVNFFKDLFINAGSGGNNCGLGFYLNASLTTGTGRWTKVSGPGNVTFSPDANTPKALVNVTEYGSYTFNWTIQVGSCTNSATVLVNFVKQVAADAGIGGHKCGNDFMLNGLIASGTGTWTSISGPGNAVFTPNNRQPNAKVMVDKEGIYDFLWTTENSNCTSSDIVRVIFHDPPIINAGTDALLCKGSSIQLHAQGTGFFKWSPAALVSNPNLSDPLVSPLTTTTFSVTLTDQFGCENSDIIKVEVRNIPVANGGPDQVMDNKFNATMNAVLNNDYERGTWTLVSGTGEILDPSYAKTSVSGLSPKGSVLLWTVSNNICPSSSDSVSIKISDLIFPTLITPNMDGRNDYLIFKGLNTKGKTELIIFDRRGVKVFSSDSYVNNWNGVDFNDTPLPDDTYFFILRRESEPTINGYIVIRR